MHVASEKAEKKRMHLSKLVPFFVFLLLPLLIICGNSADDPILPPEEVNSLKAVISELGLVPAPYIWTYYCTGSSRRGYSINIRCNCSYDNNKTCHITSIVTDVIDLSGGTIHRNISQLRFLEKLDLGSNQLSGSIPDTLGDLKHLITLNLYKNLLTGGIPPSLGKLSSLRTLALYRNRLSDPIPEALGELSNLETLRLEQNQLAGVIPLQLGSLRKLKQLRLDENELIGTLPPQLGGLSNLLQLDASSNNLSGVLPDNFKNLKSLDFFAVSGNNLTGPIPNFIAEKWTRLTSLFLTGNEFEGPLPDKIFSMSNLQYLLVSDLKNTGFSFPTNAKMPNIYQLVLRNCLITGQIPKYIGEWSSLRYLDLSFNNLTGEIPESLRGLHLNKMFLTRNMLNGILPGWISEIAKLDLSYNNFTNHSTEKISMQELNIEPNGNYIHEIRDDQCSHKSKYHSLFINCGGPKLLIEGNLYDGDNATSNFFKNPEGKWAYTCFGDFWSTTSNSSDYIKNMTCGISEKSLYKTARLCPVALTYYAFCLHQGKYDVTLHFAETVYAKEEDYSSQGKRVFDVYIQGERQLKDFNIKGRIGGPNVELPVVLPAHVKDNLLQIHLYWAGKGSLYNPPALNGPLLSAISVIPSNHNKKLSPVKITGFTLGSAFTFLLVLFVMRKMGWLGKNELDEKIIQVEDKKFTLRQIINATRNFNPRMVIGEDRFGKLYKAKLPNQIKLTVKKISPELKQQEKVELQKEITNLLSLRHDNLVKLLDGYSKKNLHLLIYEDLEKPSLHHDLFVSNKTLGWKDRLEICLGIASGLKYLHEGEEREVKGKEEKEKERKEIKLSWKNRFDMWLGITAKNLKFLYKNGGKKEEKETKWKENKEEKRKLKIVHGNVKSNNIILDKTYAAKLTDFGLATVYEVDPFMPFNTNEGRQYMAPECLYGFPVTVQADVYNFGVVMLEIVSGEERMSMLNHKMQLLVHKAISFHEKKMTLELIDKKLKIPSDDQDQAKVILDLAIKCINQTPIMRPTMSFIFSELERTISKEKGFMHESSFEIDT